MRILGIDPGLRITGYGCVEPDPANPGGPSARIVEAGVFRLTRRGPAEADTPATDARSVSVRLAELDDDVRALLARVRPQAVAVEGLFAHAAHPATAMVMGHARGVILLAVQRAGLPLIELKPARVKKFMVGSGRAAKDQMQRAVQSYFNLADLPKPPDVADALAIALCALHGCGVDQAVGVAKKRKSGKRTLPEGAEIVQ